jgi:hypothetical protein
MKYSKSLASLILLGGLAVLSESQAGVINHSLGNTASGLVNGQTTTLFGDLQPAQAGQAAPFDQGYGNDVLQDNVMDVTWTHNFGAIVDTILSASITFGIADHDSAASGSQLALFDLDGSSYQPALDGLFEADASEDTVYNEYTISLAGADLAKLADGSLVVDLELLAPGRVTPLFPLPGPNPPEDSAGNGAHLIFSTLTIETEDPDQGGGGDGNIPEPGTLLLSILGAAGLYGVRRRRKEV